MSSRTKDVYDILNAENNIIHQMKPTEENWPIGHQTMPLLH